MTKSVDSVPAGQDVALSWSGVQGPNGLSIHYSIKSQSKADIWVLDRLWKLSSNRPVPDEEAIYRFERGGALRLLLGAAPLPRRHTVTFRVMPHARRLAAGATLEGDVTIAMPVTEYSVYFDGTPPTFESKHVDRVYLLVQYVLAGPDIEAENAEESPGALKLPSIALAHAKVIVSEQSLSLDVRRRTDQFDRVTLPGEPPEPL